MPDYIPQASRTHELATHTKPALINYVAAIFAAIGSFLFGYDSGIISSVISDNYLYFQDYYGDLQPDGTRHISAGVKGAIVSLFAAGAFFGALMAGQTADRIGRKRTIQLGAIICLVGCAIQTGAVNSGMLIAGRFIAGWSVGVLSMIVPVYQAECSPPHARGLLSGWTQMMISLGFLVANWVGYGTSFIQGDGQFRVPLGLQLVPAGLLLVGMFVLPFSPRWLASKGRTEEARSTLVRLHGGRKNADMNAVEAEIQEMIAQIEWERENLTSRYIDLVNTKPNLHRTVCGCLVQAMCQWTGVNVNNYFGPTIYKALGYESKALLINGISGAWGSIVTFIFITFLVDRIGRRWPLIIGAVLLAICMAWECGTSAPFSKDPGYSNNSVGTSGIAAVFVFSWAFSWSFGPVSWIYQSEIFPMNLRALGTSVSTASNWLNNVIIGQITPIGFDNLGYRYFIVYACTNLSNAVICYLLFPETKNKTLEEIGRLFGDTNVRTPPDFTDVQAGGARFGEKDAALKGELEHHA